MQFEPEIRGNRGHLHRYNDYNYMDISPGLALFSPYTQFKKETEQEPIHFYGHDFAANVKLIKYW